MRALVLLLPTILMAQPLPKAPAPTSQTPPAKSAPATPAKSGTTAGRGAAGRGAATPPKPAGPPPLTTDEQKTIYALGLSMARSLSQFDLTPAELDIVKRAITDSAAGKPA